MVRGKCKVIYTERWKTNEQWRHVRGSTNANEKIVGDPFPHQTQ